MLSEGETSSLSISSLVCIMYVDVRGILSLSVSYFTPKNKDQKSSFKRRMLLLVGWWSHNHNTASACFFSWKQREGNKKKERNWLGNKRSILRELNANSVSVAVSLFELLPSSKSWSSFQQQQWYFVLNGWLAPTLAFFWLTYFVIEEKPSSYAVRGV